MFGMFGGKVLAFAPLLLAFLGLLALAWGALASGGVALLLTAGPAGLVALRDRHGKHHVWDRQRRQ